MKVTILLISITALFAVFFCSGCGEVIDNSLNNNEWPIVSYSVQLSWNRPDDNFRDMVKYHVYWNKDYIELLSGDPHSVDFNSANITTNITIDGLDADFYWFAVAAVDRFGRESKPAVAGTSFP